MQTGLAEQYQNIVQNFGPWRGYQLREENGRYSVTAGVGPDNWRLARMVQVAQDSCRKPLAALRVLDLGCYEGFYTLEFGLQGAEAVGIEGREQHWQKASFAANALGLDRVRFFQDDVRNLSLEKYGSFDLVLCIGILYHLNQPDVFEFMERIGSVCTDTLILDTHVALKPKQAVAYKDRQYHGFDYYEFPENLSAERRKNAIWASLDNPASFWPTRSSLVNLLRHSGFTSVSEVLMPHTASAGRDRLMLLARKGGIVTPRVLPFFRPEHLRDFPEQEYSGVHPYQYSHKVWVRRMLDKVPQRLKDRLKKLYKRA
jgi:SAM-dependent methyltransferase